MTDIVDVARGFVPDLRKAANGRFTGLCPIEKEGTPSFWVNAETQRFHCFGCGASGTSEDLRERVNG